MADKIVVTVSAVAKGDQLEWQGVEMTVTRVARDGTWCDIRCYHPATGNHWTKRQRLPMPDGTVRVGSAGDR